MKHYLILSGLLLGAAFLPSAATADEARFETTATAFNCVPNQMSQQDNARREIAVSGVEPAVVDVNRVGIVESEDAGGVLAVVVWAYSRYRWMCRRPSSGSTAFATPYWPSI